ncbi:hypothetical protein ILYODFUR_028340 [Ilyodon furcidens]|uniref:Uncharacterized protein n=1 Tax=Ilyodon furcidens TaxID=33524 RepID=A0ABV0U034_9TELE
MKHFGELEIQATWYEKLHEWEDALVAYDKKIDMNKEEPELILGRMRCLEALGECGCLDLIDAVLPGNALTDNQSL